MGFPNLGMLFRCLRTSTFCCLEGQQTQRGNADESRHPAQLDHPQRCRRHILNYELLLLLHLHCFHLHSHTSAIISKQFCLYSFPPLGYRKRLTISSMCHFLRIKVRQLCCTFFERLSCFDPWQQCPSHETPRELKPITALAGFIIASCLTWRGQTPPPRHLLSRCRMQTAF